MAFIAKSLRTGLRIDITRVEHPRETLKAEDVVCQLCEERMIIKAGYIVRAHFAHSARSDCASQWGSHPESEEHRLGKLLIAQKLQEELGDVTGARTEFEVPVREVMRIADVMVIYPNGWRVAHECQLAGITTETLTKRTEDYLHAGIDVVWWLGKSAASRTNLDWTVSLQRFGLEIQFSMEQSAVTRSQSSSLRARLLAYRPDTQTREYIKSPYDEPLDFMAKPQYLQHLRGFHQERDVRRAFEIWPQQSYAQLLQGLAAKNRSQHYGGVLGSLNGNAIERIGPPVKRVWRVTDQRKLATSHMRSLPADGVEAAKACARRLSPPQ